MGRRRKRGHSGGHKLQSMAEAQKALGMSLINEATGAVMKDTDTIDLTNFPKGETPSFNLRQPTAADAFKNAGIRAFKAAGSGGVPTIQVTGPDGLILPKTPLTPEQLGGIRKIMNTASPLTEIGSGAYVEGYEAALRSDAKRELTHADFYPKITMKIAGRTAQLIDERRLPGETDNDVLGRLLDAGEFRGDSELAVAMRMEVAKHEARFGGTISSGEAMQFGDPATETALKLKDIVDGLTPEQRGPFLEKVRIANEDPTQDGFAKKMLQTLEHLTPEQGLRMMDALDRKDRPGMMKILHERKALAEDRLWAKHKDLSNLREERDIIKRKLAAAEDLSAMAADPKLQKLGETCFHKCVEAWLVGDVVLPKSENYEELPPNLRDTLDVHTHVFVVQHNWSQAFARAADFAEGEFRLPYNDMVFEFRISGRRACCSVICADEDGLATACMLNVETSVGWALGAAYTIHGKKWTPVIDPKDICGPLMNLCREQIRAICIALEAKVAETEVIRAPHKLNRAREKKGKLPIFDHHIVSLANRKRYQPADIPAHSEDYEPTQRRLHFVRGHWRHYGETKTWINWFLRGNPDLGFIDKEYRL